MFIWQILTTNEQLNTQFMLVLQTATSYNDMPTLLYFYCKVQQYTNIYTNKQIYKQIMLVLQIAISEMANTHTHTSKLHLDTCKQSASLISQQQH